ncbi:Uma2 family endonuclease [Hymenobacter aerophilus]|uniref:Uma2 family endonuclease n=1 Tax=Hymenobacter aerophilus TaxID=119644 RepID=UPI00036ABC49|nr:Uma2 family endonuclease [Hymenobacter aerophilus]
MFDKSLFTMPAQPRPYSAPFITPQEYLATERQASFKSEYYQGQITAMAGATRAHNLLVSNLIISLGNRLNDSCTIYPSDLRVHVPTNGLYTYPDASVVCGPEEFLKDAYLDTLLNPVMLIEVLSKTTAADDRSSKFLLYKSIASLQYYLLVESLSMGVSVYAREQDPNAWTFREYHSPTTVIPLPVLGLELPLGTVLNYGVVDRL